MECPVDVWFQSIRESGRMGHAEKKIEFGKEAENTKSHEMRTVSGLPISSSFKLLTSPGYFTLHVG